MDYLARQRRLLAELERSRLDAMLITHLPNVRYLCGFTGSAGVLLMGARPHFFTDGRYREQASRQVVGAKLKVGKGSALANAVDAINRLRRGRVGVEAEHMTLASRTQIADRLGRGLRLVETSGVVERLRLIKDDDEVSCIRNAVNLGARLLNPTLKALQPGVAETDVAAKLEFAARKAGAEAMSFETIVASGARSALPHGVASREAVAGRGMVVLDYGVILSGYCSDMTRTVCVGRATGEEREAYAAVLRAQLAAIAAVAPGVTTGAVDEAARKELRRAKLAKYFTHSTGHGVGLEIHEQPRIAAKQQQLLEPGMVITIEPGVYIAGRFGVRIEDMVLVREGGHEVLTPAPKEFIEL